MNEYDEFLETVRPYVLALSSSSTEVNREAYWSAKRKKLLRVLRAEYSIIRVKMDYFDVAASYEFTLRVETPNAPEQTGTVSEPVRIACKFEGHFHAVAPVRHAMAEKFADEDAWVIFWPYFRQFVSDITSRMGVSQEMLPLGLGPGSFAGTAHARDVLPEKSSKLSTKRKRRIVR